MKYAATGLAFTIAAVLAGGCTLSFMGEDGDDDGRGEERACTMIYLPGLVVEVVDAGDETVVDGALVIARDGAYADTARVDAALAPARVSLAGERPGRYDVTVMRDGYRTWRRDDVEVESDGCHPITVALRAALEPATP